MTLFQHHLLGLGLTSVFMVGFGLFLLFNKPRNKLKLSMALYCFSVAWWSGWESLALQMPTRELSFLLMRIEYIGVVFIPTLLCTTASHLLNLTPRTRKQFLLPLYILSAASLIPFSLWPTPKLLGVSPGPVFYLPIWGAAGSYYWIFMVFFFGAIFTAHAMMIRGWFRATGVERTRLALFIAGSVFAYVGGCPEFGLKYGMRLGWLNPFGLYAFPLYIGILTYAVVQHEFFGIHVVIRRSLVYSLLITVLTVGYFGLVYGIERFFRTTFGYQSVWVGLSAFALMALLFQPLKGGIQRLVDWIIFRVPQEELARRMEQLEEQAFQTEKLKAVSTLAAGMAHEIKGPLTGLMVYTEFLPERHQDKEFVEDCHRVFTRELKRIEGFVQDVLSFAKPKSPQLQPVDLGALISSTANLLSSELLKRRVKWTIDCSQDGASIHADPNQLRQVLMNLIQNAIDAMPKGGTLTISTQANNDHVELIISDTGEGIPKELLPHIFEPFVTSKTSGNGLGLAMVHSIIKEHRGSIAATSTPARGTTFTVRLPL